MGLSGTVFQYSGYTFTKDLVFGWCLKNGDEWVSISNISMKNLINISRIFFPVYVPDDFRAAILEELEHRGEKEVSRPEPLTVEPSAEKIELVNDAPIHRGVDRIKLTDEIIEKMKAVSVLMISDEHCLGVNKTLDLSDSNDLYSFLGYCMIYHNVDGDGKWFIIHNKLMLPQHIFIGMFFKDRTTFPIESFSTIHDAVSYILKKWW